ncbi:MAG: TIGR00341 family protein [Rhodospirillales bacterium]|nr:TIGR00341 family protein [Rhodospirillales bacterium]
MQLKIVEIIGPRGRADTVASMAEHHNAIRCDIFYPIDDRERECIRILTAVAERQAMIDGIAQIYAGCDDWRLTILPVDGTRPKVGEKEANSTDESDRKEGKSVSATREELYNAIGSNATINANFIVLVMLSTIVSAIGLLQNDTAVVIGAMVIAPLLGPNLAFSFAATLGDWLLMLRALRTNLVGIALAIGLGIVIGSIFPVSLQSQELVARTSATYGSIVLALASGSAAALSLTSGLAAALVGVMVAVALLPPAAATGLLIGAGIYYEAVGAAILLAINVVCVNLSAQLVFLIRGIKPQAWLERESARQSLIWSILAWVILLAVVVGLLSLQPIDKGALPL